MKAKLLPEDDNLVVSNMRQSETAPNLAFNEQVKALIKSGRNVAHFGFGQSPFPIPEALVKELQNYAHVHDYLPTKGIYELRKGLSDFHLKYDDLQLDTENFLVAPGSKELIFLILNVFNGVIFLTSPTWSTYEHQSHLAGKHTLILDMDKDLGWKITPEVINRGLECLNSHDQTGLKLLILTNPGNPTGTCYTEQELKDITDCCRQHRIIVLSDEIYSRTSFSRRHSSLLKVYPEGTIMTNGFSKWASAGGWRIGYAYIPSSMKSLYDAVHSSGSHTYSCAPAPMQHSLAKALTEHSDELDQYMNNCSSVLKIVGDFCSEELSCVGVRGQKSEAGFYFMPDFEVIRTGLARRGIVSCGQMTEALLQEADVALMAGDLFLRPSSELTVRFCFVCFDGAKALKAYEECKQNGLSLKACDEDGRRFLEENCRGLVEGVQRLKEWVLSHRDT